MLMDDFTGIHRHCDDYIDDDGTIGCLRSFLWFHRLPAVDKMSLRSDDRYVEPVLFADFEGTRVRVVMASRFGDVGVTSNLKKSVGYDQRVYVDALTNFSDKP